MKKISIPVTLTVSFVAAMILSDLLNGNHDLMSFFIVQCLSFLVVDKILRD